MADQLLHSYAPVLLLGQEEDNRGLRAHRSHAAAEGKHRFPCVKQTMVSHLSEEDQQTQRFRAALGATFRVPSTDDRLQKPVRIPSFSIEDRRPRAIVGAPLWWVILRSNLLISTAFFIVYVFPYFHRTPACHHEERTTIVIFIVLHTVTTLLKSIPDETSTVEELNKRTNATTFVAMVLYPCIALWIREREESNNSFWNLFQLTHNGRYQWGSVFPFFMWGMSALILVRDSYHAVAVDHSYVIGETDGETAIGLFRRYPNPLEALTNRVGYWLTFSVWDILSNDQRPACGPGRFLFQLFSPVVLMFFYIGWRFMLFSAQEAYHQITCWPSVCLEDWRGRTIDLPLSHTRMVVWMSFTAYCCLIRGLVPSTLFLHMSVADPETRKWLKPRWREGTAESKRMRVLWAFRGLASAFVPWHYTHLGVPESANGVLDMGFWYLYTGVYISFFFEGLGAVFFALHEAEHACCLKSPFAFIMSECFSAAFNVILQPLGTVVNVFFYIVNEEFRSEAKLKELLGPLVDSRGDWRCSCGLDEEVPVTEEDLQDWIGTWKRKRASVGKSTDTLDVIRPSSDPPPRGHMPVIFHGTVFPTLSERISMMNHPNDFIPLKPWEYHEAGEKFSRWYPTYAEEVLSLLREPYNFEKRREVWVWGYGSLMSPDSPPAGLSERQRKLMIPYWMKREAGYRRCWNYRHGSCGINAVGLVKAKMEEDDWGEDICGIAYPMDYEYASDLFSKREDGYRLLLLHESYMEPMDVDYQIPSGCGFVWIVGEPISKCKDPDSSTCSDPQCKNHWPTEDSPILQSYLDEMIMGALRYRTIVGKNDGMNFAAALIKSTHGWSRPWLNDRILAGRAWKFVPQFDLIDGLLNTCPVSHSGFVKRLRPALCSSKSLGGLFETRYEHTEAWRTGLFGWDCQPEDNPHAFPL